MVVVLVAVWHVSSLVLVVVVVVVITVAVSVAVIDVGFVASLVSVVISGWCSPLLMLLLCCIVWQERKALYLETAHVVQLILKSDLLVRLLRQVERLRPNNV